MSCNIETFAYPSWWAGATTVNFRSNDSQIFNGLAKSDVEFLPQGVGVTSGATSVFFSWSQVTYVQKAS